jgi:CSLREA domain-containing protein
MQQRSTRFFFSLVSALLLSVFLSSVVGIFPVAAAGITVTIDQSPAGPVQHDPTNTSPIVFRVIFTQAVADFAVGDVDLGGSTGGGAGLSYTISGSGAIYNVSVTGMASGDTVVASIPADVVTAGAATNTASTSTDSSVFYETVKPTATINQAGGQADPTNAFPILYTAVFSENVTGFDAADVVVSGSAPGVKTVNVIPVDAKTYTVQISGMTGSGTVVAAVRANAAQDAAGNWSVEATSSDRTVTYNITPPTVTINQSPSGPLQRDPANASPIVFQAIFSASVTGFGAGDVDLSGSTGGGAGLSYTISGSGAVYNVSVTGMTSGNTVVATVLAGAAIDLAGNASLASTSTDNSVLYDTTPPTVTINQAGTQADPTAAQPIVFTVVFSENVTGFDAADVVVSGSAPGVKTVNVIPVDAKTYTVEISGMTGRGTVSATVRSNAAQDAALNWSMGSTSTDRVVGYQSALVVDTTVDKNSGACVLGNCSLREAIANAVAGDNITFNLTYPATITLTSLIDINRSLTIAGPGAGKLIIQGAGSNRVFIGHVGNTTTISDLTIAAGSDATQGGGIYNAGTLTLNKVVLSGNTAPSGGAIYNQGTLTITKSTLSHNHATSGAAIYNAGTLSMTNSTLGNNSATGQAGGIYNAGGATMTLLHTSVVDNPGGGVYNAGTMNYTSTVIAKNGAAGDCALAGAGSLGTNLNNFVGTATCSASLNGNPLLGGLGSVSTEPLDTFAPLSASPLLDAANAGTCPATDERGVPRPIGVGCDIGAFEGNLPSVTVNQAAGQADPTATGTILFTVVFGDPVTGFAADDVVLSGTATGTLTPVVIEVPPNNGTTYQISVTGMTGTGTVIATVKSGAAQNAQGNDNGAPTFTDHTVTYDVTSPTVAVNQSASGPVQRDPTNSSTIYFWVVFSEPVTGFTGSDISFSGSTVSGTLSVSSLQGAGASYLIGVTGMTSDGLVVASLPASQVTDLAGNPNTASTSTDNQVTYDKTPPTVTINQAGTQSDPASVQPVVFTVVFSEAVTGFDAADVLLSGTAGGVKTVTVVMIDAQTYRVEISGITTGGTVIASVRPNAAQDAAMNWSPVSTSTDHTVTFIP